MRSAPFDVESTLKRLLLSGHFAVSFIGPNCGWVLPYVPVVVEHGCTHGRPRSDHRTTRLQVEIRSGDAIKQRIQIGVIRQVCARWRCSVSVPVVVGATGSDDRTSNTAGRDIGGRCSDRKYCSSIRLSGRVRSILSPKDRCRQIPRCSRYCCRSARVLCAHSPN